MSKSSKGKDTERKNVILSAMQKYDSVSDKPEKGKEIELKPYESFDYICGNILGVADYLAMSKDESTEKSSRIIRRAVTKLIKIRTPTRTAPKLNIDELTGVIESVIQKQEFEEIYLSSLDNTASKLIAQAITSHLNGKGDGDE